MAGIKPLSPEEAQQRKEWEEKRQAEQDRAWRCREWDSLLKAVGKRYANCRLDTFKVTNDKQRAVVNLLKGYAENIQQHVEHGDNVVLFGPPGSGKDHLVVGLAHVAIRHKLSIRWFDGQSLYQTFRDAIDKDKPEGEIIDRAASADVLLLSDPVPPRGELSDFQTTVLWRIIDRRYRDMKPTWVTLNVASGEEATQRMGSSIVDRLRDGATYAFCAWESYRKPLEQGK